MKSTKSFILKNVALWYLLLLLFVIGFGKTCLAQTFNFAYLEIHKNHREWYTDLQLSGMIKK